MQTRAMALRNLTDFGTNRTVEDDFRALKAERKKPPRAPVERTEDGAVFLGTPLWRGELVRDPATREDPVYFGQLYNGVRQAIEKDFEPYLANGGADDESFLKMLEGMHTHLGEDGYTGYMGGLDAEGGSGRGSLLLRTKPDSYRHWASVNKHTVPEMASVKLGHLPEGASDVRMPGFSEGVVATNTLTRSADGVEHLYHQYLAVEHHRPVLARMNALMQVMRSSTVSPERKLEAMAEYHYLGVHTQPFFRVNNSLLMAQVNTLLKREGLRGMPHGVLDYEAWVHPFSDYLPKFLAAAGDRRREAGPSPG